MKFGLHRCFRKRSTPVLHYTVFDGTGTRRGEQILKIRTLAAQSALHAVVITTPHAPPHDARCCRRDENKLDAPADTDWPSTVTEHSADRSAVAAPGPTSDSMRPAEWRASSSPSQPRTGRPYSFTWSYTWNRHCSDTDASAGVGMGLGLDLGLGLGLGLDLGLG